MKEQVLAAVFAALEALGIAVPPEQKSKITVTTPDPKLGDFATNAALILAKTSGQKPIDLARTIADKIDSSKFEKVEAAAPGFINFRLKNEVLLAGLATPPSVPPLGGEGSSKMKVLLEYFQPNIAKPLHIGHLRTAVIGDALKRMMKFAGLDVESDNHLGDWGTQFGVLILAYKKYGKDVDIAKDPIPELNKLYVQMNQEIESDKNLYEQAKAEFVKLEKGDEDNRKIWEQFTAWSLETFNQVNKLMAILPFEHKWPESFYEDKMPAVLEQLKSKGLLVESQGAQIVNLEQQKLGVAVLVKSDEGTTYLLRDLATFIFRKDKFDQQLYVVDNRQSHHFQQMFVILKLLGVDVDHSQHIDYGFISFKGEALSTRKGNMVLAEDVLAEARKRVAKVIKEKNPDLADKDKVIQAVAVGAIKYYDLSHNRKSDFEFNWDEALDFESNSGPYLQYAYARLSGILSKVNLQGSHKLVNVTISSTERELMLKSLALGDAVSDALNGYLPNLLANYLYEIAGLVNRFYHESPVMKEGDEKLKFFRLTLIQRARTVLGQGLNLLGIEALEEM